MKELSNKSICQDVTWIHPVNVKIEQNSIQKISGGAHWNATAFSLQYLNRGDSGSIEFVVPKDFTQVCFIGFSSGCIDPNYLNNLVGVKLQQYTYENERPAPPRMEYLIGISHLFG